MNTPGERPVARRSRYAIQVAVLAAILLTFGFSAFLVWPRISGRAKAPSQVAASVGSKLERAQTGRSIATPRQTAGPAGQPERPPNYLEPLEGADAFNLVKIFDFNMQYPPGSRPAFKGNSYQLDPDRRTQAGRLRPARTPDQQPSEEEPGSPEYSFEFVVHDQNLGPGETFIGDLTVLKDQEAVPFVVREMRMINDSLEPPERLVPPTATPLAQEDAGASPYVQRIRWRAASAERAYWGSLLMAIKLEAAGREFFLAQAVESTPMPFARFTGNFNERLERGSLYLDVEISSEREAWCEISGRLYHEQEPTHVATWTGPIQAGKLSVTLEFFGKIFHDLGFKKGRLELRQLRGKCQNLPFPAELVTRVPKDDQDLMRLVEERNAAAAQRAPEPLLMEMAAFERAYTTRRVYTIVDFSGAVWDSPEKTEKRAELVRVQAAREESGQAQPLPAEREQPL